MRVPTCSSDTGLQAPMEVASGNSPVDAGTPTRPKTIELSVYVMEYISQNHRLLCQKQARKDLFEHFV